MMNRLREDNRIVHGMWVGEARSRVSRLCLMSGYEFPISTGAKAGLVLTLAVETKEFPF
jgi:hypothetical protein